MSKAKWVTLDRQELTVEQLEKIKTEAAEEWHKADNAIKRARSRRNNAEEMVRGCNARIRFLKALES